MFSSNIWTIYFLFLFLSRPSWGVNIENKIRSRRFADYKLNPFLEAVFNSNSKSKPTPVSTSQQHFEDNPFLHNVFKGQSSSENPLHVRFDGEYTGYSDSVSKSLNCGRRIYGQISLIRKGSTAKEGDWPWHVAIFRRKTVVSQPKYICGGSLVSSTRVITAGHCVVESTTIVIPERLLVHLGKYDLYEFSSNIQEKHVFEIILHPDYDPSKLKNDLAILKLSTRAIFSEYVQPICLWKTSNKPKSSIFWTIGTVVGWGFDEEDTPSGRLKITKYPVVSDQTCFESDTVFYEIFHDENKFCAGFANGTSACNGDSGSGLVYSFFEADGTQRWYLRGIVSSTHRLADKYVCDPYHYTLFTDITKYNDFIDLNL